MIEPDTFRQNLTDAVQARWGEVGFCHEPLIEAAVANVAYSWAVAAEARDTTPRRGRLTWLHQQKALALLRAADCCARLGLEDDTPQEQGNTEQ